MLNNKRDKNRIILDFIITIGVFIIFIVLLLIWGIPSFYNVEAKKQEFINLNTIYKDLQTKWLEYSDNNPEQVLKPNFLDSVSLDTSLSEYTKSLLSFNKEKNTWLSWSYYNDFLKDFKDWKYKDFNTYITIKKANILKQEKEWSDFLKTKELIWKILPKYDESIKSNENLITWAFSSVKFISFIEELLFKYSFDNKNSIWISQIVKVDNTSKWENWLETIIYYIPLSLDINWDKKDILDFIDELVKSGNLYYNSWTLLQKDNFWNYKNIDDIDINNIWQLITIDSIKMEDYMDDSITYNNYDFVEAIRNWQTENKASVSIDLRFYISWLSHMELSNFIKSLLWDNIEINMINDMKKILSKNEKDLLESEKKYKDFYNKRLYSWFGDTDISKYWQLKIRTLKYLDILEKEPKKSKEDYLKNLQYISEVKKQLFEDLYNKDIKKVINDNNSWLNIKENIKLLDYYINQFKIIEKNFYEFEEKYN